MSSWVKKAGGILPPPNSGGGGPNPLRSFRRQPYPMREERKEDHQKSESFESLKEVTDYSGTKDNEHSPHQSTAVSLQEYDPSAQRTAVFKKFYQQLHGDGARQPADCVVLSVSIQSLDYPKSIGQCLQERGLSVEMLYLQAESGLTRALQDVRSDGSPLCILVEQNNVTLSSCTVIIFSESLKIHRNMPKEQAMEFVMVEFRHVSGSRQEPDPTEAAVRAAELTEDYLERGKLEHHAVPSATRHLLFLLAEGLHLYPEELSTLAEYLQNRQDHLQATSTDVDSEVTPVINSLPPGLGKPPPLLPAGSGLPPPRERTNPSLGSGNAPLGLHMGSQGSYPKTKPPPLLSIQTLKPPSHRSTAPHGPSTTRAPSVSHGPSFGSLPSRGPLAPQALDKPQPLLGITPPCGPSLTRSPLLDHIPHGFHSPRGLLPHPGSHSLRPPLQNGPRGPRVPPPSLRSLHMGAPTGSGPRPPRRLLP
ncbi:nuclear receptor coactivator 5-like [Myxocyprinus asiaticus]|uniref:nuclear receptor coactivator 5-like n=1 Tax=Myxocyprinus asiaticus TaxID=70543 RepID=UPI0022219581|nr:nuclear receptor coactivator 5-like [Myxocyprinus asiaticus]XP_051580581.1 nuclear receptor coactivator 5-like [Myxocyprinus asiaticus]XP_051580582.1 nuclear receptor coactivator 5-like [Myxocyprinus asiaticus]XP_051580583.1 nuclear receptor coactivator 5-like [Myxocyprinus asiaticus]